MVEEKVLTTAREYAAAVRKTMDVRGVFLYGSHVRGEAKKDSDIDIAIVVENLNDDYFADTPLLWKLKRKISNLIEPVLLTEDKSNPLYTDILKTGILI